MDARLPFSFAQRHGIFVAPTEEQEIVLYCRADTQLPALQEARRLYKREFAIRILETGEFDQQLQKNYANQSGSLSIMDDVQESVMGMDEVAAAFDEPEDLLSNEDDAPVIKMLNAIFFEAIREKASDIHIEPYERELHIRFRLNGVLRTILTSSAKLTPLLVSRIKVLARLDIAEKRLPQDGRITVRLGGRNVDLRVSTLPSSYGERVVLRVLDKQTEHIGLNELGMKEDLKAYFKSLINRPHGIVLVTGPTGSGKTTTLYAALAEVDRHQRNIMTIEDPIEYNFEGISQTQVNTKADMTFARGLRAILRQDPDVVLIGEIRDSETATIATQASLTGHLVLSTLHTNTAIGAITRLGDMGVEPFLLTATLQGILAQRLVRRLCSDCREAYIPDEEELRFSGLNIELFKDQTIYRPKGCEKCSHTGYTGRFGLYDLVTIDDELKQMVHDGASEIEMRRHVYKNNKDLRKIGCEYILQGDTTLEEVIAVTIE
ncbi:MAG: type II secretion system ATPase GspE [Chromatiales bacterium]|nr:type II secretion system ATPase GspE [Chromatiales bacterium]